MKGLPLISQTLEVIPSFRVFQGLEFIGAGSGLGRPFRGGSSMLGSRILPAL